jgi:hypothetical protein
MEKEFVPYELAVKLKELGYDGPCFGVYIAGQLMITNNSIYNSTDVPVVKAPTLSQAFRFFRERYNAVCEIIRKEDKNYSEFIGWVYIYNKKIDVVSYWDSKTYEEAELACLEKLIEIVESIQEKQE